MKSRFGGGETRRRVVNLVVALVILGAVAPFVVYAVPQVVGGQQTYIVLTGSMDPAISPGDAVVVGDVRAADVAVGDVLTFYKTASSDVPVTHRVIEVVEAEGDAVSFVTKGDANEDPDATTVGPSRVVGRVVVVIPFIGYVIQFINTPYGFVALIAVPMAMLLLGEAWSYLDARRARAAGAVAVQADPDESVESDRAETAVEDAEEVDSTEVVSHELGDERSDGLTFTPADLTLASVTLPAFALYAGYVAYTLRDTPSVMVAMGAATAAVLVVGVRFFGFGVDRPVETVTDGGIDTDPTTDDTTKDER
jgi:signal peptidase